VLFPLDAHVSRPFGLLSLSLIPLSKNPEPPHLKHCYFCGICEKRLWHEPGVSGFLQIKPGTLGGP
jgi:hypothetical protein